MLGAPFLPVELRVVIVNFAQANQAYSHPANARGKCSDVSFRFVMYAFECGVRGVEEVQCEHPIDALRKGYSCHIANRFDGAMIDFTATQFWDEPWPLIEHVHDYAQRFVFVDLLTPQRYVPSSVA